MATDPTMVDAQGILRVLDTETNLNRTAYGAEDLDDSDYLEITGNGASRQLEITAKNDGETDVDLVLSGKGSGKVIVDALSFESAATERAIDLGSMTTGTTTDGVIMRVGTGIGTSAMAFGTADQRGFALYMRNTATSGTFTGMRLRSIADPASAANSINNFHCQASCIASKNATTINSGFFELIPKGTNTITTGRVLLCNADSAATQVMTTQIIGHFRVHTRGDETITNDEMLRLENEAVGGNGRQLDSFIRIMEANMSGGIKSAAYMIDAGTGTNLLATGVLRVPDDGTVCNDTDTGAGTDLQFSDFTGYLTVVVGSATRYIPLLTSKPSDLS